MVRISNSCFALKILKSSSFRWKEIIETSCLWHIQITEHQAENLEEFNMFIQTTKRKFMKFEINSSYSDNYPCVVLALYNCDWSLKFFVEIVRYAHLKQIWLYETNISYEADVGIPELEYLKTLRMFASSCDGVLKSLVTQNLTNIQIDDYNTTVSFAYADPENIKSFLHVQSDLKTLLLDFSDGRLNNLSLILDGNMPFRLTHLSLGTGYDTRYNEHSDKSLSEFLDTQAATITSFDFNGCCYRPFEELKLFFSKLKNLKSLSLHMSDLPNQIRFYEQLEKMNSIETLLFEDGVKYENRHYFEAFIRCVPNVKELRLGGLREHCDNETLRFISKNLICLEKLYVKHFVYFAGVQFSRL